MNKLEILKNFMKPTIAPKLTFYHGRHGHMTNDSDLQYYRYELEMSIWRMIRRLFYKELKSIRRWENTNK